MPLAAADITGRLHQARARLRASGRPVLQAAIAAPLAWWLATTLFGHAAPIFAPISALVAIGATVAQPWQRAAEIVFGVAFGVAVADALVKLTGHGAWQIGFMVLLAMVVAIAIGGTPTVVLQSATAAVLVASLPSQEGIAAFARFLDTLAGGGAALVMTLLVLPVRPLQLAHDSAAPVLDELAGTFEDIGAALGALDAAAAERALARARRTGDHWARLNEAVGIGRQAARIAPVRRREEEELLDLAQCVVQLDYAIRDTRILARVGWRLVETGYPYGPRLELSMLEFASAARALEGHLTGEYDATLLARDSALRAARIAASAATPADALVFTHWIGQVRSTTVDMLRATGMTRDEAITRMLDAVHEGIEPSDVDADG
jgi:uncharacterized membrane protein YgaE (UPF0421/DUF939 family)